MPYFNTGIDIDIDPWEFVSSCNQREINALIDTLIEEGYISPSSVDGLHEKSALDFEWDDICEKIRKSRLLLTSEEETFIKNVSNRL